MSKSPTAELGARVRFAVAAEPGSRVFVAGTFNNWNPTATPLKHNQASGYFRTALRVTPGTHEYKFVVNDVWQADAKCPHWALNGCGSLNSVLHAW